VTLGGTFPWSAVGDFVRVGGTVTVDGTLDNTGNALMLDGNTGSWVLAGTLLSGSVEVGLAGSELRYAGNSTLNGVTVNADMDLSEAGTIAVNLVNGLTLNATALMGHDGGLGRFVVSSPQTIGGNGEMFLGKSSVSNGILVGFGGTLIIGPDLTIRGARGGIGTNAAGRTTTIQGTVRADSSGFAIDIEGSEVNNEGTVHAAGGTIQTSGPFLNTGLVQVDSASTFTGSGSVTQDDGATVVAAGGTFTRPYTMNAGTLSGGGTFTNTVTLNGGTIAPGASPGHLSGATTFAQGVPPDAPQFLICRQFWSKTRRRTSPPPMS
jgi:hypothetical protein